MNERSIRRSISELKRIVMVLLVKTITVYRIYLLLKA